MPAIILEAGMLLFDEALNKILHFTDNRAEDFIHLGWHPLINEKIYFKGSFDEEKNVLS